MTVVWVALAVVCFSGSLEALPLARAWPHSQSTGTPSVDLADADGLTPLMRAAARGALDENTALLARGASIDAATKEHRVTAPMFAAYLGRAEVVRVLLAKRARIGFKDAQGAAAVDWAALGDHPALEDTLTRPDAALSPFLTSGLMPIWLMDQATATQP
ncbi:MAG: ankyrin repeat domain-containing protein [Acidobacteriota bacterium]|nr:ankyrin repeat domain-containing protein [Acidobacteriota bacterium]